MHPARLSVDDLLASCTLRAQRRSGPGGQHRNKVETAIVIEHQPTGLRGEASERRSQADNRRMAIHRLRLCLALEHRETPKSTSPESTSPEFGGPESSQPEPVSPLWHSRVSGTRIDVSTEHEDFPAILAELLDALQALAFDVAAASKHFAVTSSQLVNLLRSHPPALTLINAKRTALGLHRLR
ncbi:MAG: peptide chain release factor-like protein [Pirellulaceae bacterium]|nr:peptide chain release factor-like protein [Pirellulaceae bacterium]